MEYQAKGAYQTTDVARVYDDERFQSMLGKLRHRCEAKLITWAISVSGIGAGASIADIPTGTGRFIPMLHDLGMSVTAVDVSGAMLGVAKARKASIRDSINWVNADASTLPFHDNSFDAVLSIRLMNHLPVPVRAKVLDQFARIGRRYVFVAFTDVVSIQGWLRAGARRRRNVRQYPASVPQARRELASAGLRLLSTKHLMWGISETYMCVAEVINRTK